MKVTEPALQPKSRAAPTESSAAARSLTTTVFQLLRSSILYGQLEPGLKLSAGRLATQYRVSLSAIREALARLAAEGLLDSEDHRGFRVAKVSKADLMDLTQTRCEIECIALRRSIESGDAAWEERVTEAFQALQAAEGKSRPLDQRRYELHSDFHHALLEACGSEWLLRLRGMLFERAERYRLLSVNYAKVRREVHDEHKQLYDAVLKRDAEKAIAILTRHTMETTKALLQIEDEALFADNKPAKGSKKGRQVKLVAEVGGLLRSF
ncbi:GntR family transcriptional regulator [Burkholderia sp. AU45388]|jgi:DNA-binding GntR family transcriptional regulator|uniref:GntR family transcriptional regulator n=1 Tax=Burkholderia sp. AU45388 TaxID=3059206 RepID=UPI002653E510|nr:GntR family transcriptional regulator [Burkholderia sp. AU45388]MDN7431510.1 GntR family transcriptional regulator [Burkholderia sp. AU45388]